ncbi:MAG: DHH family phosphoesterase [Lachnospiraceae bacterium]|nr:DHH family phosphoesterase [Lachnospiraceae bacterium]
MQNRTLKSQIERFLQVPLKLLFILIFMVAFTFWYNRTTGIFVGLVVVFYAVAVLVMYYHYKPQIMSELVAYAFEQGQIQKELLKELAVPYALMDMDGMILWYNSEFGKMVGGGKVNRDIRHYFPHITKDMFPGSENDMEEFSMSLEERQYHVQFRLIRVNIDTDENDEDNQMSQFDNAYANSMIVVYFFDETDYRRLLQENKDQKLIAGLIYIDNYDEVLESTDEVRQPLLMALVDRKINKTVLDIGGIIKKPEKDKYFIVFQQKYLAQLQANKFELLDEVRNINVGNELPVTLSMSIGMGSSSYQECYELARMAMDMALGRGGDQVVIRDGEKTSYYGGQSRLVEKNTRVKARVKAHALQGIMEAKEKVVIMGHSLPDVDCFGSALGIYKLAKAFGKEAYIVINEATISIRPVLSNFVGNSQYDEDMFVDNEKAKKLVDMDTLLMIVDVNRPSYTECPELLELTKTIVVFDHHRQTSEIIGNAVLSYVEPYASSACEMVAEVLQYTNETIELKPIEADAIYAGMLVDTDNFVQKTGARTFEAAAYLRRKGADVVRVRKMFRDSMETYRRRAEAVRDAEVYRDKYALAIFPAEGVDSPTVIASQVANELLDIEGIGASFVVTHIKDTIYISARSIDVINVQLVMEQFNGGGHANAAGAQLHDCSVQEALEQIKKVLDELDEVDVQENSPAKGKEIIQ